MTERCEYCEVPLEEDEYPLCTECQLIEEGVLAVCPKCEDVVPADELTGHGADDRCDGCRRRARDLADDISDYHRRIR